MKVMNMPTYKADVNRECNENIIDDVMRTIRN